MNEEMLKERMEATNRLNAEIRSLPCFPEVSRRVRAEYDQLCAEVKARRLARARKAAASRWSGHSAQDWTTVCLPKSFVSEIRGQYPKMSVGKVLQKLWELHRPVSP